MILDPMTSPRLEGNGHIIVASENIPAFYVLVHDREGKIVGKIYTDMETLEVLAEHDLPLRLQDGRQANVRIGPADLDEMPQARIDVLSSTLWN